MHLKSWILFLVFAIGAFQYASSSPVAVEQPNAQENFDYFDTESDREKRELETPEVQSPVAEVNNENEEIGNDAEFERIRRYLEDEIDDMDDDDDEDEDDDDDDDDDDEDDFDDDMEKRSIDEDQEDDEDDDDDDDDDDDNEKRSIDEDQEVDDDDDDDNDGDDNGTEKRSLDYDDDDDEDMGDDDDDDDDDEEDMGDDEEDEFFKRSTGVDYLDATLNNNAANHVASNAASHAASNPESNAANNAANTVNFDYDTHPHIVKRSAGFQFPILSKGLTEIHISEPYDFEINEHHNKTALEIYPDQNEHQIHSDYLDEYDSNDSLQNTPNYQPTIMPSPLKTVSFKQFTHSKLPRMFNFIPTKHRNYFPFQFPTTTKRPTTKTTHITTTPVTSATSFVTTKSAHSVSSSKKSNQQIPHFDIQPMGGKPVGPIAIAEELNREYGLLFAENPEVSVSWHEPYLYHNCWITSLLSSDKGFPANCNKDGTYAPKQCFLQRCWCVNKDGTPLEADYNRFYYKIHGAMLECTQHY